MRFTSLGSGSRGNAIVVESSKKRVLIDCGLSFKDLSQRLEKINLIPEQLDAVFITHEHSDHIKGLKSLIKNRVIPVFMTYGTYISSQIFLRKKVNFINDSDKIFFGDIVVEPVFVPHDAREPCQFLIYFNSSEDVCSKKLGILTDLGSFSKRVSEAYKNCDALIIECNHDEKMLSTGSYPKSLKNRVSSDWGHLSNRQSSEFVDICDKEKLQWLVLAHLSKKNNTEALALNEIKKTFPNNDKILVADQDKGFDWLSVV